MSRTFLLLVLTLIAVPVPGQDNCGRCRNKGVKACRGKDHDPRRICGTKLEHKCSALYRAACCRGTLVVPCDKCERPEPLQRLFETKETRRKWVAALADTDDVCGAQMTHIETKHFIIHFSIENWSLKKKRKPLTRVKAAHKFAEELEALAERFQELTGVVPAQAQVIDIVASRIQQQRMTKALMSKEVDYSFYHYQGRGRSCQWPRPPWLNEPPLFRAHVLHNATHLLTRAALGYRSDFPAWFDGGLAHWLEGEIHGHSVTFCVPPDKEEDPWKETDMWKKLILDDVRDRNQVRLEQVLSEGLMELSRREHAYCWSFMDYLIRGKKKGKFQDVFRTIKTTNDSAHTLKEVLGMAPADFDAAWRTFVIRRYR